MCFSTAASFSASAVLAVVGFASLKKVKTKSQLVFATLPLVFSIQQLIEGFVWLTLLNNSSGYLHQTPIYLFVFFAQILWPTWVPLSFLLLENNTKRKKILGILFAIGIAISIHHLYYMLNYTVDAKITPYHVYYQINFPDKHFLIHAAFYLLTIILPPFISSVKKTHVLGILLLISFIITKLVFNDVIVSVWCFFAALISLFVFIIMRDLTATPKYNSKNYF